MRKHIFILIISISPFSHAGVADFLIEGRVKKFDKQKVTILSKKKIITAPRRFLDLKKIRSGQIVSIRFQKNDFDQLEFGK